MLTSAPPRDAHTDERSALHDLTNELHELVPVRRSPDQAIQLTVLVPTADDVRAAAARAGQVVVDVHVSDSGAVHTSALIGYGAGSDRRLGVPEYHYAAILNVVHIASADDAVDDVLGERGADR